MHKAALSILVGLILSLGTVAGSVASGTSPVHRQDKPGVTGKILSQSVSRNLENACSFTSSPRSGRSGLLPFEITDIATQTVRIRNREITVSAEVLSRGAHVTRASLNDLRLDYTTNVSDDHMAAILRCRGNCVNAEWRLAGLPLRRERDDTLILICRRNAAVESDLRLVLAGQDARPQLTPPQRRPASVPPARNTTSAHQQAAQASSRISARALSSMNCAELWEERNAMFHRHGYCFQTDRGQRHFGLAGCDTADSRMVFERRFSATERSRVNAILEAERANRC